MATVLGQVTLGAAATQVTTGPQRGMEITFQNNAAAVCRVGDSTVSATRGISLAAAGVAMSLYKFGPFTSGANFLNNYWLFGAAGNVIDYEYVTED